MAPPRKCTSQQIRQAARWAEAKMPWSEIARRIGVTKRTIRAAVEPEYAEECRVKAREMAHTKRRKKSRKTDDLHQRGAQPITNTELIARLRAQPPDNRSLTARVFGDPPPGRSALDQKRQANAAGA